MPKTNPPFPSEITRANDHDVLVKWRDGHESLFLARPLRLACPCAGCRDEVTGEGRIVAKDIPEGVHPLRIAQVGNYAIAIEWSDGHRTGIYSFRQLRALCPCRECHPT